MSALTAEVPRPKPETNLPHAKLVSSAANVQLEGVVDEEENRNAGGGEALGYKPCRQPEAAINFRSELFCARGDFVEVDRT